MKITVKRGGIHDESTTGELFIDGLFECFTLEDKDRYLEEGTNAKVYGRTAIPRGEYRITITLSNRFKKPLPLLHGVPGFDGIRIHAGNTHDDTDGCILVGHTFDGDFIGESRKAMDSLQPKIQAALDAGEEVIVLVE